MAIQDRITQIALSKQTALASPAASGSYQIGVSSGAVAQLDISEDPFPMTWASRMTEGFDRASAVPGVSFETLAMPISLGLLLKAVCGTEAISGSSPYSHTFTQAGTSALPYLTAFARRAAEYYKVGDLRVNELELAWDGTKALTAKVGATGCTYSFLASAYSAIADERPQSGVLKGAGGTFSVDGTAAVVKSGSIKISNDVKPVLASNSTLPVDVFPGMQKIELSLVIIPEDLTLFRSAVTGTTGGSTVANIAKVSTGTTTLSWKVDANTDLTFTVNTGFLKFATEFPDTNADGGPVEITLAAEVQNSTSATEPFTFVLRNTVAAVY